MRYFTRAWASGELTDAEWEHALAAYRARTEEIAPRLPRGMLRLTRDVSLHDGLIEQIVWNPTKRRLRLSLVCGNVQSGYYLLKLTYDGAMLGSHRIASLKRGGGVAGYRGSLRRGGRRRSGPPLPSHPVQPV